MFKWRSKKVIDEAEDYLKATDAVSRPMAIFVTLSAIIIIAALVFTLFLGGRWVYNQFKDDEEVVQVEEQGGETSNVPVPAPETTAPATEETPSSPSPQPAASTYVAPSIIPNTGPGEEY